MLRSRARWAVLHGVGRVATNRWAAQGDLQARLIADPAVRDDPHPVYEQIRARGVMTMTKIGFVTADHEMASTVLRSDDFRTTKVSASVLPALRWIERATRSGAQHPLEPPSLLATDPPTHPRYRALVSSVFTARAVAGLRPAITAIADDLLDELAAVNGPVDIVERYCARLPVAVIGDILGVPADERDRVLELGSRAAPSLDFALSYDQFRDVEDGLLEFDRWLDDHLDALRRDPGDDLLSRLINARVDGVALSRTELRATAGLVLAAGFETTVNLLSSGVELLASHPDETAVLRAAPETWPNAVDEILRFDPPVQLTARVARQELRLQGRRIPDGAFFSVLLAAANRDPAVFPDPDRFDVSRGNANRHLSFSGGRHFCLGAALARLEGEIGLRRLFERFPELARAGRGARRPTRVLRGWAELPVRLGAEARSESV